MESRSPRASITLDCAADASEANGAPATANVRGSCASRQLARRPQIGFRPSDFRADAENGANAHSKPSTREGERHVNTQRVADNHGRGLHSNRLRELRGKLPDAIGRVPVRTAVAGKIGHDPAPPAPLLE